MLNVTKTNLPPLEDYVACLREIWACGQLTNQGPMVRALEAKLKSHLEEPHLFSLCNGAMGLHLAAKAYSLRDSEVITTPFSFVSTTSALTWEGAIPVFADIEPDTLTIDPACVAKLITPKTKAILATHVFGNACDTDALESIAANHGLKVIYDAAHAYGARYKGRSLAAFGDASMVSFHATKIFQTAEGGLMYVKDAAEFSRMELMRRFGIDGPENILCEGTNYKMSELCAAMGVCTIDRIPDEIADRRRVCDTYDRLFDHERIPLRRVRWRDNVDRNYSYYPVIFPSESALLAALAGLRADAINPRRYFYPSLNTLPFIAGAHRPAPVSESVASRILCLPLHVGMPESEIARVVRGIADAHGRPDHE